MMHRSIWCKAYRIWIVVAVWSATALAQDSSWPKHRVHEVTGFAGSTFGVTSEFPTAVSGSDQDSSRVVEMRYDPGYVIGVRYSENLNDYWGADLEYSFADQTLRFKNLSPAIPDLSLKHYLHHLSYGVSVFPRTPRKRFRPYGNAGIAAALFYIPGRAKKDAAELGLALRDSWQVVFNFGGGFRYLIYDEFAVTLDFKNRLSRVPSYGLPSSARVVDGQYQPGLSRHGVLQIPEITFGFSYQWDEF